MHNKDKHFVISRAVALALMSSALVAAPAFAQKKPGDSGLGVRDIKPGDRGVVSGLGIGGRDIVIMSDSMARDLLSVPRLAAAATPPRVVIDDRFFENTSSQRMNKAMITDRLRVALNRSSAGRMVFIGRQMQNMIAEERELKRDGVVDSGTTGLAERPAGADYRLSGKISSEDATDGRTGAVQRYMQILFEMHDLETGEIIWSNMYEFERAGADDVVYR